MLSAEYAIRLAPEGFGFTATHFIIFSQKGSGPALSAAEEIGGIEPPHTHHFRVGVKISGPLNDAGYVVDFTEAARILRELLAEYHRRILLPKRHAELVYFEQNAEIEVRVKTSAGFSTQGVFPKSEVLFLDEENITAERLCALLAGEYVRRLVAAEVFSASPALYPLAMTLEEAPGMIAETTLCGCGV